VESSFYPHIPLQAFACLLSGGGALVGIQVCAPSKATSSCPFIVAAHQRAISNQPKGNNIISKATPGEGDGDC